MQTESFDPPFYLSGIIETLAQWLRLITVLVILVIFFRPVLLLMGFVIGKDKVSHA